MQQARYATLTEVAGLPAGAGMMVMETMGEVSITMAPDWTDRPAMREQGCQKLH